MLGIFFAPLVARRRRSTRRHLTTQEVMIRLGLSADQLRRRALAGQILFEMVDEPTGGPLAHWRWPSWQFSPNDGLHRPLPSVLSILSPISPTSRSAFFEEPHQALEGSTPRQVIERHGDAVPPRAMEKLSKLANDWRSTGMHD